MSDASGDRGEDGELRESVCIVPRWEDRDELGRGVPMFMLPTLDVDALKKAVRHRRLAQGCDWRFDGRLPPAMKLLLAGDAAAAKAIAKLGPGFEFQDVDATNAEQLAAAADLATGIKSLLADLNRRGRWQCANDCRQRWDVMWPKQKLPRSRLACRQIRIRGTAGWVPGVVNPNDTAAVVSPTTSLAI